MAAKSATGNTATGNTATGNTATGNTATGNTATGDTVTGMTPSQEVGAVPSIGSAQRSNDPCITPAQGPGTPLAVERSDSHSWALLDGDAITRLRPSRLNSVDSHPASCCRTPGTERVRASAVRAL